MALINKLTSIADAIRAQTGRSEVMTLDQMPGEIAGISGEGGGLTDEDLFIMRAITQVPQSVADECSTIGPYAFAGCGNLTTVNFPNVTTIGSFAFSDCYALASVSLPNVTAIGSYTFWNCSALLSLDLPNVTELGDRSIAASTLRTLRLSKIILLSGYTFASCYRLTTLDLTGVSQVPTLSSTIIFQYSPLLSSYSYPYLSSQYGDILVPKSLYQSFTTASVWNRLSSRFVSI